MKGWSWILVLVAIVLIFIVGGSMLTAKRGRAQALVTQNQIKGRPPISISAQTPVPSGSTDSGGVDMAQDPGTIGGPTVLTRSQCRQTCRGICGKRALIGARARASKACWSNCKNQYCAWETGDL